MRDISSIEVTFAKLCKSKGSIITAIQQRAHQPAHLSNSLPPFLELSAH